MAYSVLCNVSNQVIHRGNPCRAIALVRQMGFSPVEIVSEGEKIMMYGATSSITHPSAYWSPIMLACPKGRYDEYGGMTSNEEGPQALLNADWHDRLSLVWSIVELMPDVLPGENSVHDVGFCAETFMAEHAPDLHHVPRDGIAILSDSIKTQIDALWNAVWKLAHEDRLFIKQPNGQFSPVKFALIHEAAYQGLMDTARITMSYGEEPISQSDFVARRLAAFIEGVAQVTNTDDPSAMFLSQFRLMDEFRNALRGSGLADNETGLLHQWSNMTSDQLRHYIDTGDIKPLERTVQSVAASVYVLAGMDRMHLSFQPIRYVGEDFENDGGRLFEEFIRKTRAVVDRVQHEYMWGPYETFRLLVSDRDQARALIEELNNEWDCRANMLGLEDQADGRLAMTLEATMGADDFAQFAEQLSVQNFGSGQIHHHGPRQKS